MLLPRASWWFAVLAGLLLVLSSVPAVESRGLAGGFERVIFYYIYRMAVLTWGKNQNRFFPDQTLPNGQVINCATRGSHKSGGCNIREFINFLNNANLDEAFWDGVDLDNPDPIRAAGKLWEQGSQTGLLSAAKLFPPGGLNYDELMVASRNLMREIHTVKSAAGQLKTIEPMEIKINISLDEAIILRQSDMISDAGGTKGLIVDMQVKFPNGNPKTKEEPYHNDPRDPNRVVISLDEVRTITESPAGAYGSPANLKNFVSRYGKDGHSTEISEDHYKVLKEQRMFKAVLYRLCQ